MDAIIKFKVTVPHNLDVVFSFLQCVLGELEWKTIKIKENSAFHSVPLNFHEA